MRVTTSILKLGINFIKKMEPFEWFESAPGESTRLQLYFISSTKSHYNMSQLKLDNLSRTKSTCNLNEYGITIETV